MRFLRSLALGATLALLPLALTLGCDKKSETPAESTDLSKKVAEAEKALGKTPRAELERSPDAQRLLGEIARRQLKLSDAKRFPAVTKAAA